MSDPDRTLRTSDLAAERIGYFAEHLLESRAPAEPFALFDDWLAEAIAARDQGAVGEPTAMTVATVEEAGDGSWRPRARMCLLKGFDESGFVFFTNYESGKGRQLARMPWTSLLFYWPALFRQVRVEGSVAAVEREESEAYWRARPRDHQLGAYSSAQSQPVRSLEELEARYDSAAGAFANADVPCPPHWGGYLVRPEAIEFWQGQPSRMHDRLRYSRSGDSWRLERLSP